MRPLDPRLLRYADAARTQVLLAAVAGLLSAGLIIAQALGLARVISGVFLDAQGWAEVRATLFALVGIVAARAILAGVSERIGQANAVRVISQLRMAVLRASTESGPIPLPSSTGPGSSGAGPSSAGDAASVTELCTRGLDALEPYMSRYLPQLLMSSTVTPLVLAVIMWQDLIAGLTVLFTLPLIPLFMALIGWSTAAAAQRRLGAMRTLGSQMLDLIAGLDTLHTLGRAQRQGQQIAEVGERYRRATMATLRRAFASSLVLESLTTLSVALVAVGIGLRLVFGELDLQTGLSVLILAPEAYLPLRLVGVHYHASVDGLAAAQQALTILDTPSPSAAPSRKMSSGRKRGPDYDHYSSFAGGTIRLRGVGVRHPGRGVLAPADLDLDVAPGEVVALRGPSGAGKSTAVRVILGLQAPSVGSVGLDSPSGPIVPLSEVDLQVWHREIAWVPQHPAITPGTLRDNLWLPAAENAQDYGPPSQARIEQIAALCGLSSVVAELSAGWDTVVGHGGHGLSAGQRQRLALTRALLRPAHLVILDEPSAHLDASTEQHVHRAIDWLREQRRTVLVVAHRPGLAGRCDREVWVHARLESATAVLT